MNKRKVSVQYVDWCFAWQVFCPCCETRVGLAPNWPSAMANATINATVDHFELTDSELADILNREAP